MLAPNSGAVGRSTVGEERHGRAESESESPPFPLTHRVPFGHDAVNGERGHGMGHPSPRHPAELEQQAVRLHRGRGGAYAETARGPGADPGGLPDRVKRAGAAQAPAGDDPFQMAGGPPRAEARGRAAEEGGRDAFGSERLLRRQAAVGARAERAKFAFMLLNEGAWAISEMCSAPGVTRQGYRAWREAAAERARPARRRAGRGDLRNMHRQPRHLRRPEGLRRAQALRRAHLAQARGAHHARERPGRHDARLRQAPRGAGPGRRRRRPTRRLTSCGETSARTARNRARFADIAYVRTHKGWPCLAVVMDIWSRKIVGWSMSARMTAELADDALRMAIARRRPPRGLHPPFGPRLPARVAPAREDDARRGHQALHGLDIVAVGTTRPRSRSRGSSRPSACTRAPSRAESGRRSRSSSTSSAPATACGYTPRWGTSAPRSSSGPTARGGPPTDGGVGV